jgi:hypothetical protein
MVPADQPAVTNYQHSPHYFQRPPAIVEMLPGSVYGRLTQPDFLPDYRVSQILPGAGQNPPKDSNRPDVKPDAGPKEKSATPPGNLPFFYRSLPGGVMGPDGKIDIDGDGKVDPAFQIVNGEGFPYTFGTRVTYWRGTRDGRIPYVVIERRTPDDAILPVGVWSVQDDVRASASILRRAGIDMKIGRPDIPSGVEQMFESSGSTNYFTWRDMGEHDALLVGITDPIETDLAKRDYTAEEIGLLYLDYSGGVELSCRLIMPNMQVPVQQNPPQRRDNGVMKSTSINFQF